MGAVGLMVLAVGCVVALCDVVFALGLSCADRREEPAPPVPPRLRPRWEPADGDWLPALPAWLWPDPDPDDPTFIPEVRIPWEWTRRDLAELAADFGSAA